MIENAHGLESQVRAAKTSSAGRWEREEQAVLSLAARPRVHRKRFFLSLYTRSYKETVILFFARGALLRVTSVALTLLRLVSLFSGASSMVVGSRECVMPPLVEGGYSVRAVLLTLHAADVKRKRRVRVRTFRLYMSLLSGEASTLRFLICFFLLKSLGTVPYVSPFLVWATRTG